MQENTTSGEIMEAAAPESGHSQENQVPVHVVQTLRSENQQLKENVRLLAEHMELLKANQPRTEAHEPVDSLNDQDVLTVGEAKKYISGLQRQYQMGIEELKISQMYPDYTETIRKYLPHVLKEEPDLKVEIENARNPYKLAYQLAKKSAAYLEDSRAKKKNEDAERILSNSQKTGSLSAVGSTSPISQASHWKSMSEDDFKKVMNKNAGMF